MSLIDKTYFRAEINLPAKTYSNLEIYIQRFEKDLLIKLFGYKLYKLISAYDINQPEDTEQRIRDIIEGKEFDLDDQTYKWNGLINSDKVSPIAYYVYYFYIRNEVSQSTTTGEKINNSENAENTNPNNKLQFAWNELSRLIGNEYCENNTDYFNSLYFFMTNNSDTYPEWIYDFDLGSVNIFDL